jgi:hypothetical protein
MWQLVDDAAGVSCLYPSPAFVAGKGGGRGGAPQYAEVDEAQVAERLGVAPSQVVDFKALAGDASDDVAGVAGIGEKTAVRLLQVGVLGGESGWCRGKGGGCLGAGARRRRGSPLRGARQEGWLLLLRPDHAWGVAAGAGAGQIARLASAPAFAAGVRQPGARVPVAA